MTTRITCPNCRRLLLLPPGCTAEVLSCPRCLAQIDNPQTAEAPPSVLAETLPTRAPGVTPSRSPARGVPPRLPDVDGDVRRDNRRTGCLMTVLPVLGGLGIAYDLAVLGRFADLTKGDFGPWLFFLGVLMVLTLISAAWVATHQPSETTGGNIGRVVLGVLTVSGAIFGVGVLLGIAGLIFLFVVCLSGGGPKF